MSPPHNLQSPKLCGSLKSRLSPWTHINATQLCIWYLRAACPSEAQPETVSYLHLCPNLSATSHIPSVTTTPEPSPFPLLQPLPHLSWSSRPTFICLLVSRPDFQQLDFSPQMEVLGVGLGG